MIEIKPSLKGDPRDATAAKKYYARAVATGSVDLERLAYLVSHQSSVNEGDCYNVIITLVNNIVDELQQGKIVKLDRLGAFQVSVNSVAEETAEAVTANSVVKSRMVFRPDTRIRNMLKNLKYKVSKG
ncbi:HU family DNA-binding protein [Wenyingzhuangia sp. IMCC45574]